MRKCRSRQIYSYDFYVSKLNILRAICGHIFTQVPKFNWILVIVSYLYDREEYNFSTWIRLTRQEWAVKELVWSFRSSL